MCIRDSFKIKSVITLSSCSNGGSRKTISKDSSLFSIQRYASPLKTFTSSSVLDKFFINISTDSFDNSTNKHDKAPLLKLSIPNEPEPANKSSIFLSISRIDFG